MSKKRKYEKDYSELTFILQYKSMYFFSLYVMINEYYRKSKKFRLY